MSESRMLPRPIVLALGAGLLLAATSRTAPAQADAGLPVPAPRPISTCPQLRLNNPWSAARTCSTSCGKAAC